MKPAWEQLGDAFESSKTVVIGDVDCTVEKDVCSKYGVRGYPTIKYFSGSTGATGDDYSGGRDFNDLKKFADENLGPSCSPADRDLCDEDQLKAIDETLAMSDDDLAAAIKEKNDAIEAAEKYVKEEVEKLQERYQNLNKEKDEKIAELSPGLRLLNSVSSFKKKQAAGGHDEL